MGEKNDFKALDLKAAGSTHLDIKTLTKEAEAGQGSLIKDALKDVSFDEQIKIMRQIEAESKKHHKSTHDPLVTYQPFARREDEVIIGLTLTTAWVGPEWVGISNSKTIYSDVINLMNGRETKTATDL